MEVMNENKPTGKPVTNFEYSLFLGCLLTGLGIGLAVHHAAAGTLIGLGLGFLALAIHRSGKFK